MNGKNAGPTCCGGGGAKSFEQLRGSRWTSGILSVASFCLERVKECLLLVKTSSSVREPLEQVATGLQTFSLVGCFVARS